ncbi:MAG: hypothetical protein KAU48_07685, partial [Candidatus Thorarchaeota archaeon]|nr:hypothetical protein [Candidatus Thorarchaeota archaeon]
MKRDIEFNRDFAFQVMKGLCDIGPRVVASEGEAQAAEFIKQYFSEFGLQDVEISKYPFRYYDGLTASISNCDGSSIVAGVPCWMSASTPKHGIEAETLYIGSHNLVSNLSEENIKDKIVFVLLQSQYMPDVLEAWIRLFDMSPAGVVFLDLERDQAPRSYNYQKLDTTF